MNKGTKWILILSLLIGLGVAAFILFDNYQHISMCENDRNAYLADEQEWNVALTKSKYEDQAKVLSGVSLRTLERARDDEKFRVGDWNPPICYARYNWEEAGGKSLAFFFLFFIGLHVAWLLARAFNKMMQLLK